MSPATLTDRKLRNLQAGMLMPNPSVSRILVSIESISDDPLLSCFLADLHHRLAMGKPNAQCRRELQQRQ